MQSYTTRAEGTARINGLQKGCCTSEIERSVLVQASNLARLARIEATCPGVARPM